MTSEALALTCSHCGGTLAVGDHACTYCGSAVAARRCDRCFHLNLAAADHCAACGAELGLEPVPKPSTYACPRCAIELDAVPTGRGDFVLDCSRCGGQFVEHATLRALCEDRVQLSLGNTKRWTIPPQRAEEVHYLPCPICRTLMNRKNFGERSGVLVSACREHGIWVESGGLARILAFVETGGLQAAIDRLAEEKAKLRASAALAMHEVTHPPYDPTFEVGAPFEIAQLVDAFWTAFFH